MKTKLLVTIGMVLVLAAVGIALAAVPQCGSPYCVRHDNSVQHNIGVPGTFFNAEGKKAGSWLVWIDSDGKQSSITITGHNVVVAWLPEPNQLGNLVPNPEALPNPSNFTVTMSGMDIVITAKSGFIPKEFLLGVRGMDNTIWGVRGSVSALPTKVPTATPLPTSTPVMTATPLPTLAPPATATIAPTPTP